jgi:TetR/AcrR family transcriptional regulator, repressor for neighboring sulfatase
VTAARPASRRTADEIVDAIGAAAHRLFMARGPAAVSLRDVAAEADVNLGLIHRYVGSKDEVVALVLDRHGMRAAAALDGKTTLVELLDWLAAGHRHRSGRLFAGIILDDIDALSLKREFPIAKALVAALERDAPWCDPVSTAALLQSLVLGWEVFSSYLIGATGARSVRDPETLLREALQAIVDCDRP